MESENDPSVFPQNSAICDKRLFSERSDISFFFRKVSSGFVLRDFKLNRNSILVGKSQMQELKENRFRFCLNFFNGASHQSERKTQCFGFLSIELLRGIEIRCVNFDSWKRVTSFFAKQHLSPQVNSSRFT